MPPQRTAIVLSGGGSRGAYQAGALLGMRSEGCRPDVVIGTSVGAINGAYFVGAENPESLRDLWTRLRTADVLRFRFDAWRFWRWKSIALVTPLRRLLEKEVDFARIHTSHTKLLVTAVDLCCARTRVFRTEELTVDHLLAASAIPGIFPPVEINGHSFVDGAVLQSTPVKAALEEHATDVFVVVNDRYTARPRRRTPRNLPDVMVQVTDAQAEHALLHDLRRSLEVNEMVKRGVMWKEQRHVEIHVLEPKEASSEGVLRFREDQIRSRLAAGEEDGKRFFREISRRGA